MKTNIVKRLLVIVFALTLSLWTADSCMAQSSDKNTEELEQLLTSVRKQLPKDYGNGKVNTKFVREGDYVIYYYECDERKVDIDRIGLYANVVKSDVNEDNFYMNYLRKVCKNAGVGIEYYYIGKTSGKTAKILIPVSDLK